ncbi:glycosyltransferase family 9 protein [Hyalangium rubrum]|uniref:Glycosyltransferase family 9 protein n=1 Tax=Hyalangium rubrum TaxID=3103134 RepID=A0ABU5H6T6_9BACT|nr:glycosyltransferase family 9 protein [Hyalangium sp. s54d21]MDY7228804.1 glycosyltransferase family 9 protein [Hyalangium sp. s54d21]
MTPERPVVFHVNGIGDRVMALPAVRALSTLYPGRLSVIGVEGDGELLYSGLPLRLFHALSFEWVGYRKFDARTLVDAVGGTDLLLSLNTWNEDVPPVLELLPEARTLGFFKGFTDRLRINEARHSCDMYFDFVQRLEPTLKLEDFTQPPSLPEASVAFARDVRASLGGTARVLVVHTETGEEKRWPAERFRRVLREFLARHPEWLALVVDVEEAGLDADGGSDRVFSMPRLMLPAAMALVSTADMFLGVDSCMLHMADICRVPGVGLFGPTTAARYGFRFGPHRHVEAHGPMMGVGEAAVLEALEALAAEPQAATNWRSTSLR